MAQLPTNYENFSELDFEKIKDSLKTHLKGQEEFKDYDFEGSAINSLINVLAYSTQYNAFYLNMHASERFIGTAQRRENLVHIARNLGYIPRSNRSAVAYINVELIPKDGFTGNSITIPKGTVFSASDDDVTSVFNTEFDVVVSKNSEGRFITTSTEGNAQEFNINLPNELNNRIQGIPALKLFEGRVKSFTTQFNDNDTGVTVPNAGIDTTKLEVFVKDTPEDLTGVPYVGFDTGASATLSGLNAESRVYFPEETVGKKYRVVFGDNIIGSKPTANQFITVNYVITLGAEGNGLSNFELKGSIPNVKQLKVITPLVKDRDSVPLNDVSQLESFNGVSGGGQDIESNESIRANAPLIFSAQNRAVTKEDYKAILPVIFPETYSSTAFGVQELLVNGVLDAYAEEIEGIDEELRGYVYVSVIKDAFDDTKIVSNAEKRSIESALRESYSTVSILPVVVDPAYTYIRIKSRVAIDSRRLSVLNADVESDVKNLLFQYGEENFSQFDTNFFFSRLTTVIDNSNDAILSNDTEVEIYAEERFSSDFKAKKKLVIGDSIIADTVITTEFQYTDPDQPEEFYDVFVKFDENTPAETILKLWVRDSEGNTVTLNEYTTNGGVPKRFDGQPGVSKNAPVRGADEFANLQVNIGKLELVPLVVAEDGTVTGVDPESVNYTTDNPLRLIASPTNKDISFKYNRVPILRDTDEDLNITVIDFN